jgi:quercetin dioxygenase-like cupin family protein
MSTRFGTALSIVMLAGAAIVAAQTPPTRSAAWETLARLPLPEESDPVIAVSNFRLNAAPPTPLPIGAGHTHQGPVIGYVIEGEIETQIEPAPAAFYRFMRNTRTTEPARLITFAAGSRGQPVPFITVLREERLASTRNQDVSLLRITLPPGVRSDAHAHSGPGLVYVLQGNIEAIGAAEPRSYSAGETLLDPAAGTGLTFRNVSNSDTARLLLYQVGAVANPPRSQRP